MRLSFILRGLKTAPLRARIRCGRLSIPPLEPRALARVGSIFLVSFITLVIISNPALADDSLFYKELNIIGGYSDRGHWVGKSRELLNSLGLEYYRKFSGEYADYLTTDLQLRVSYDSRKNSHDAWGIEVHNAWLEHKLAYGANLRLGHFDPAFGLEPLLDTHGTILQTLAMKNMGLKKDWGAGLEGSLPKFDYKLAMQLGSGMSIYRRDDSFLLTSRIGSPASGNWQYGLSFLYGRVLESEGMRTFPRDKLLSDDAVSKKRIGLDGQYLFGPYLFKAETAYGKNNDEDVLGYLAALDYTIPKYQNWSFELQFQSWINDLSNSNSRDSTLTLGTSYKLNQNITLRSAFSHDLNMANQNKDNKFLVQFYYFGL
ncbi:MAG: hypothetical protein V1674_01300 [Candidatus Omnitrophota bacterium]